MPPLPPLILHVGDAIKGGELCSAAILILFGDAEASGADVMVATGEIVILMAATSTAIAASGTARGWRTDGTQQAAQGGVCATGVEPHCPG
ncbi:hypothetical protein R5R35_009214 [Gryllus longicercus]|uniref:Uncharacterized protein n=1 Tax=Gryllus longicercus TaxID=2509291 RepID=A0AAN9V7K8_9ORTH